MLTWSRYAGEGPEMAFGREWVYLVTGRPGAVILARYRVGAEWPVIVAAQAARNAIPVHPKAAGEDAPFGSDLGHARELAQRFEDGESFFGHPAWQHEEG